MYILVCSNGGKCKSGNTILKKMKKKMKNGIYVKQEAERILSHIFLCK